MEFKIDTNTVLTGIVLGILVWVGSSILTMKEDISALKQTVQIAMDWNNAQDQRLLSVEKESHNHSTTSLLKGDLK